MAGSGHDVVVRTSGRGREQGRLNRSGLVGGVGAVGTAEDEVLLTDDDINRGSVLGIGSDLEDVVSDTHGKWKPRSIETRPQPVEPLGTLLTAEPRVNNSPIV